MFSVPFTVGSIIVWTLQSLKVNGCSEHLSLHLAKIQLISTWKYFMIGFIWKLFSVVSNMMSTVLLLIFLWLHLLFRHEFGNHMLDFQNITRVDILVKLSNLDIQPNAKYYLYLLPFSLFIIPLITTIWAQFKYIGLRNEFSVANAVLSSIIPSK